MTGTEPFLYLMIQNMCLNFAKNLVFSNPSCFKQFQTSMFSSATSLPKPRISLAGSCSCERYCSFRKSKLGLVRDGCYAAAANFRNFSSSVAHEGPSRGSSVAAKAGDSLPWLTSADSGEMGVSEKFGKKKGSGYTSWEELAKRKDKDGVVRSSDGSTWGTGAVRMEQESRSKNRYAVEETDWYRGYDRKRGNDSVETVGEEEEEREAVDDPKWDRIKGRIRRVAGSRPGKEDPRVSRWNRQENWGRRTWREATASAASPPNLVGEGVYGVGPVLAALSAGRREFYTLFVQEGLDLISNNLKKKDKKGFENVLTLAKKFGLGIKEASKHDLNMVVDNRPHQGLVLDASPLEMVRIFELDRVSSNENEGRALWIALDEVMDPQNLGVIIRSAYFFRASGVVLCTKSSAPLSGVVSKASAGSLELMEMRYCKNMMQFLISSADNGWRVLGGSISSKSVSIHEISSGVPTILVLGSEGTGLQPLVERSCTQLVKIPGNLSAVALPVEGINDEIDDGLERNVSAEEFRSFLAVESLNVSVAAGVLIHHLIGKNNSSDCDYGDINL